MEATETVPAVESLWPAEFIAADLPPNHCADVLAGSYDVPFNPRQPPTILDLGANIGAFARWAAKRWPGCCIDCYEPHPGNFAMLEKTAAGIDGAQITLHNQAVLNLNGRMQLTAGKYNCGEHSLFNDAKKTGGASVEVEVISAKSLPRANILKIDTEGSEHGILVALNAAGRLKDFACIMLEYHAAEIEKNVTKMLRDGGFQLVGKRYHGPHRGELKFMRRSVIEAMPKAEQAQIPTEEEQSHFLSIIAFNGNITAETMTAVLEIQHKAKAWRGWKIHTGEGQVRSRNECMNVFLQKTPFSHMLFLDADVMPRDDHILNLRRHPEAADAIICGIYCKKVDRIEHVYNSLKGGNPQPNNLGLMEVAKGATGFMQIPRVALERMMAFHKNRFYKCDYEKDENGEKVDKFSFCFHDIRIDQMLGYMRDQSEDWAFCELAREAGVKIYVDVTTTGWEQSDKPCVLHKGQTMFPLRVELERLELNHQLENERKEFAKQIELLLAQKEALETQIKLLDPK